MSMFKNLKSLFVVEDEEAGKKGTKTKQQQTKPSPKVNNKTTKPVAPSTPRPTVPAGTADPKFTDKLLKAIEANNQPGFDYLEFKQTIKQMRKMGMEESMMYKSAFAAAQAMGVTPNGLVESVKFYLNILSQEQKKFGEVVKHQTDKNIINRQQQLKDMAAIIKNKEAHIQKLQAEIDAQKQKLNKEKQELSKVTGKIEATQSNFTASYDNLRQQLMDDVKKINQYLGKS